jgi:predicted lipid-binding transport protein (Tim44 family)
MIDIIIFAILSVIVIKKLKSILGQEEDPASNNQKTKIKNIDAAIVYKTDPFESFEYLDEASKSIAKKIIDNIPGFSLTVFEKISSKVLEIVINAYDKKDLKVLSELLTSKVLSSLQESINSSEKDRIALVSIKDKKIIKISQDDHDRFKIEILFNLEQIHYTEDENGNIVSGSKSDIVSTKECWSFVKSDKNWLIEEIKIL